MLKHTSDCSERSALGVACRLLVKYSTALLAAAVAACRSISPLCLQARWDNGSSSTTYSTTTVPPPYTSGQGRRRLKSRRDRKLLFSDWRLHISDRGHCIFYRRVLRSSNAILQTLLCLKRRSVNSLTSLYNIDHLMSHVIRLSRVGYLELRCSECRR